MKTPPPSPRITKAPNFEDPTLTRHFDRVVADISRELQSRVTKTEAAESILLISPSGKVYKITVDDAGSLITTELAS